MRFAGLAPFLPVVVVVATLGFAPRAGACVSGIVSEGSLVTQQSQIAFISKHATTTDIALLLSVPSADQDFGALIPLPGGGEPTVDPQPVDAEDFGILEASTRPQFIDFSGDVGGGGGLFSCGSPTLAGDNAKGEDRGVVAAPPVEVGPITAQWLLADDATALTQWLTDEGYALPAGGTAVVDAYLAQGNGFLAFKRTDGTASAEAVNVGVHFSVPGDLRSLPIRIASLGAPDVLPVTVFVAADEAVGAPAPWTTLHSADLNQADAIADYAAAVDAVTAEENGKVFIFEGALGKGDLQANSLTALIDDGAVLSRLSARIPQASLDADAIFNVAAPLQGSAAAASAFRLPKNVDVAALGLVGITLLLRRRRR
ncbi:MAG: DUF2330 domain-containing protein [Deltaproteobacteria bacterium]|nr:DUF2330 domain-containing protein [Deltaproteobacteria bacterium]